MHKPFEKQWPVTSTFKAHIKRKALNPGTDYGTPVGVKIYAMEAGTFVSGVDSFGAKYFQITVRPGRKWQFVHLSRILVKNGQVKEGQLVGLSGKSGKVTGPHTHITFFKGGKRIDPEPYVRTSYATKSSATTPKTDTTPKVIVIPIEKQLEEEKIEHIKTKKVLSETENNLTNALKKIDNIREDTNNRIKSLQDNLDKANNSTLVNKSIVKTATQRLADANKYIAPSLALTLVLDYAVGQAFPDVPEDVRMAIRALIYLGINNLLVYFRNAPVVLQRKLGI